MDNSTVQFVEIDENKIMKLKASVNQIEANVNIENPFITLGKSYKQKEIQEALKKYNLSTKSKSVLTVSGLQFIMITL